MHPRDEIEAGSDLTETEINAAKKHVHEHVCLYGHFRGIVSYVQRHMRVGYAHAIRLVECMEADRFITPPDDRGNRKFL